MIYILRTTRSKCKYKLFLKVSMNEQASRFSAVDEKKVSKHTHLHRNEKKHGENDTQAHNLFRVELFGGEQPVKK